VEGSPGQNAEVCVNGPDHDGKLVVGDTACVLISLPRRPVGSVVTITELGHVFLTVEFADGRLGYYTRRQLKRSSPTSSGAEPASGAGV
jgi:hypothetical protein